MSYIGNSPDTIELKRAAVAAEKTQKWTIYAAVATTIGAVAALIAAGPVVWSWFH